MSKLATINVVREVVNIFSLSNYITKEFDVECISGVKASSVNGKIKEIDYLGNSITIDDSSRRFFTRSRIPVNQETQYIYYTRVYVADKNLIEMRVLEADWICRRGLNWHVVYKASIDFEDYKLREEGSKTLEYWLGRCLDDGILIPKEGFEEPVGKKLGEIIGINDFIRYYGENVRIIDIFKAYESRKFYGKTGFYDLDFKKLKFGVEIEFTGMKREDAAKYLAKFFGTSVIRPRISSYDRYTVKDRKDRVWSIKNDSSIRNTVDHYGEPADNTYACELETPILEYGDIETLQELVRGLRKFRYMKVNNSCGLHIHVGGDFSPNALKNVYNLVSSHQKVLTRALNIRRSGLTHYCKYVTGNAYAGYNRDNISMDVIRRGWNATEDTRYRFVNFESYFSGKGIEFRCFNSTNHAGKVKAYIQFCLALCTYAKFANEVHPREKELGRDLTRMRNWLHVIGLSGDEFKTCRYHLTSNLKDQETIVQSHSVA